MQTIACCCAECVAVGVTYNVVAYGKQYAIRARAGVHDGFEIIATARTREQAEQIASLLRADDAAIDARA